MNHRRQKLAAPSETKQGIERRQDILDYLVLYRKRHPYGPSLAEVARACGLSSKNTVRYHLRRLREQGLVTYDDRTGRSLCAINNPARPRRPAT